MVGAPAKSTKSILLGLVVALSSNPSTHALTINVPADEPTIQSGIDESIDGDTILVAPGIYIENIDLSSKNVCIIGSGREVTTLTPADPNTPAVFLINPDAVELEFSGFTVTGVEDVPSLIIRTPAPRTTSAMSVIIRDNTFLENGLTAAADIPVISLIRTATLITENIFIGNGGSCVGLFEETPFSVILNNTFDSNRNGIWATRTGATVLNNIFTNFSGTAVTVLPGHALRRLDYNNTWNNSTDYSQAGIAGLHSMFVDPLYIDQSNGDLRLESDSPCIDAGAPETDLGSEFQVRADVGALQTPTRFPLPTNLNLGIEDLLHVVSHTPNFNWTVLDSSGGQTGYEILVRDTGDSELSGPWSSGQVLSASTSVEYTGAPLSDGQSYFVLIRLKGPTGWGSWTTHEFRMNSIPPIPNATYPFDGQLMRRRAVDLYTQNVIDPEADPLYYDYEVYSDPELTNIVFQISGAPQSEDSTGSGMVTGLETSAEYWWRARASDGFENTPWSDVHSFNTLWFGPVHVPSELPNIQVAIDASFSGDTILVAPGTYTGDGNRDINLKGRSIALIATGGAEMTTIDCQGTEEENHRGFMIVNGEDSTTLIQGFTITNALRLRDTNDSVSGGGGALVTGSSVTFRNCNFVENSGEAFGGGVFAEFGSWINLENCNFRRNFARILGGGVYAVLSNVKAINCSFSGGNEVGTAAGVYLNKSSMVMTDCQITDNHSIFGGTGIYCIASDLHVERTIFVNNSTRFFNSGITLGAKSSGYVSECLFVKNTSSALVGIGGALFVSGSYLSCNNSTFYDNSGEGGAISADSAIDILNCVFAYTRLGPGVTGSNVTLSCCNIFGNEDGDWVRGIADQEGIRGNFSAEPMFCDTVFGNFSLRSESPCLPENNSCGQLISFTDSLCLATDVGDSDEPLLPNQFSLSQNYPNPFNPSTTIKFSIPKRSDVTLTIYNILGQEVTTLVDRRLSAGEHTVAWDGVNNNGKSVATGVYFYRLTTGQNQLTREMILIK